MALTETSKDALIKQKGVLIKSLDDKAATVTALTSHLSKAQGDYDQTLAQINDIHADLGIEPYVPKKEETKPIIT